MANCIVRNDSCHNPTSSTKVGFMLFGVLIGGPEEANCKRGQFKTRNSQSLGNLAACNKGDLGGNGYLSDGVLHQHSKSYVAKKNKGKPWTQEEHRSFLLGLAQVGKGAWKEIAARFVPTKTAVQVASHAQKYFNRMAAKERRRRSIFDEVSLNNMSGVPLVSQSPIQTSFRGSSQTATTVTAPTIPLATANKPPLPPMVTRQRAIRDLKGSMINPIRSTPVRALPPAPWVPLVRFSSQTSAHLPSTRHGLGGVSPFLAQPWLPGGSSLSSTSGMQHQGSAPAGVYAAQTTNFRN